MISSMKNYIETIKKDKPEMVNIISEIKTILDGRNCRLDESEHQIHDLEDKVEENTQSEQQKEFLKMRIL